jgi:hypothetical protein
MTPSGSIYISIVISSGQPKCAVGAPEARPSRLSVSDDYSTVVDEWSESLLGIVPGGPREMTHLTPDLTQSRQNINIIILIYLNIIQLPWPRRRAPGEWHERPYRDQARDGASEAKVSIPIVPSGADRGATVCLPWRIEPTGSESARPLPAGWPLRGARGPRARVGFRRAVPSGPGTRVGSIQPDPAS